MAKRQKVREEDEKALSPLESGVPQVLAPQAQGTESRLLGRLKVERNVTYGPKGPGRKGTEGVGGIRRR